MQILSKVQWNLQRNFQCNFHRERICISSSVDIIGAQQIYDNDDDDRELVSDSRENLFDALYAGVVGGIVGTVASVVVGGTSTGSHVQHKSVSVS